MESAREDVQQLDLIRRQHVTASRSGDGQWKITRAPLPGGGLGRAKPAGHVGVHISRESVIDENASNLASRLDPPQTTSRVKTKDCQVREIRFGSNNSTGNSTTLLSREARVLLVTSTWPQLQQEAG